MEPMRLQHIPVAATLAPSWRGYKHVATGNGEWSTHEQHDGATTSQERSWRWGLKETLRFFACASLAVLITNIAWVCWAKTHAEDRGGFGTIKEADCNSAKRLNTWLHLLINFLSTLIMSGSSAFLQAYSSPSRAEIHTAHSSGRWLDVGLLSMRNLRRISFRKGMVVVVLALSSIPFHLL